MNKLESFLMSLSRHGKIECRSCGSFNKKGYPCRCEIGGIMKEAGIKVVGNTFTFSDSDRLKFLVDAGWKYVVRGKPETGYIVWDQTDGLVSIGEGKTYQEAIDMAMRAKLDLSIKVE